MKSPKSLPLIFPNSAVLVPCGMTSSILAYFSEYPVSAMRLVGSIVFLPPRLTGARTCQESLYDPCQSPLIHTSSVTSRPVEVGSGDPREPYRAPRWQVRPPGDVRRSPRYGRGPGLSTLR